MITWGIILVTFTSISILTYEIRVCLVVHSSANNGVPSALAILLSDPIPQQLSGNLGNVTHNEISVKNSFPRSNSGHYGFKIVG